MLDRGWQAGQAGVAPVRASTPGTRADNLGHMAEPTSPPPAGSADAADRWVAAHADALFAYCLPRVRDRDAAEDVVQETFLAALQGAAAFRGDAAERTWLIGIMRHKIVDLHRRRARERQQPGGDGEDALVDSWFDDTDHWKKPPAAWCLDPAALADNREFWEVVQGCMGAMPTRLAATFTLRVMEEAEAETVCQELAITPTNLWVMLHRARARLRACLEERWFGGDAR